MKVRHGARLRQYFTFSARDVIVSALIFALTLALCLAFRRVDSGDAYVPMLFILAVFLTSRFTNGYLFGISSAVLSVLAVNFIFTYPYFAFNFTLSGYPLSIICMLAVAIITSAMTTQIKRHSDAKIEAEREKTRGNLLRAVSHDLRTPLTSILGASSAIIENNDSLTGNERLKLLSEIKEDAQWLIRMVENLLSVTRIDGERNPQLVKTSEAAEEVAAASVEKFKKRFPEWSVSVGVPAEPLFVPMDAILVEQVIINLLENAVLHSGSATGIRLLATKDGRNAVFEVADDGDGIPDDILPNIFDGGFRHAYGDGGDAKKNMGIGLSVCRTIVKAHGGSMTAGNGADGGAVFRFTLPLEEDTKAC